MLQPKKRRTPVAVSVGGDIAGTHAKRVRTEEPSTEVRGAITAAVADTRVYSASTACSMFGSTG